MINVADTTATLKKKLKILRVTLDNHLTMDSQVSEICRSAFCARRLSVERYSYSDVAGWVAGWLAGWLSHAGTVSKRLNLSENFFDHLKAPSF